MKPTITILFFYLNLFIFNTLEAQQFYHYEDFFNDSAFILKNNIKVVNIRIPELYGDSSKEYYPYQKLCFNPYGKLAWYEYDFFEGKTRRKYYNWYFYDESARRSKSRIFQRCDGRDSLREESLYMYDPKGRLYHEEHYQIYIFAYREWSFDYDWQGDSLKIKIDNFENHDTARLDTEGREVEFVYNSMRYQIDYNKKGKKERARYFWLNDKVLDEYKVDEVHYIYDKKDKLIRLETDSQIITFEYDDAGLPISSASKNKFSGEKMGPRIYYDYEMREESFVKQD